MMLDSTLVFLVNMWKIAVVMMSSYFKNEIIKTRKKTVKLFLAAYQFHCRSANDI